MSGTADGRPSPRADLEQAGTPEGGLDLRPGTAQRNLNGQGAWSTQCSGASLSLRGHEQGGALQGASGKQEPQGASTLQMHFSQIPTNQPNFDGVAPPMSRNPPQCLDESFPALDSGITEETTFILKKVPYGVDAGDLANTIAEMECGRTFDLLFVVHGRGRGMVRAKWTYAILNFPRHKDAELFSRSIEALKSEPANPASPLRCCDIRSTGSQGFVKTLDLNRTKVSSADFPHSLHCIL